MFNADNNNNLAASRSLCRCFSMGSSGVKGSEVYLLSNRFPHSLQFLLDAGKLAGYLTEALANLVQMRAEFQALVPCEEFQRQCLESIEHVAEEFR